jgi:hypothetical protein
MGLFTRRQRDGPVARAQNNPGIFSRFSGGNRAGTHARKEPLVLSMNTRPSFGQWLKVTWLDLVTMVIMGILGLGVSSLQFLSQALLQKQTPGRSNFLNDRAILHRLLSSSHILDSSNNLSLLEFALKLI